MSPILPKSASGRFIAAGALLLLLALLYAPTALAQGQTYFTFDEPKPQKSKPKQIKPAKPPSKPQPAKPPAVKFDPKNPPMVLPEGGGDPDGIWKKVPPMEGVAKVAEPVHPEFVADQNEPKFAAILFDPNLEENITTMTMHRMNYQIPRLWAQGYEVRRGPGDIETITRVLMSGKYKQITFIGHGGRKVGGKTHATMGPAKDAAWWKAHLRKAWEKHLRAQGKTPDQAKREASQRAENFGLDEVVNMSCWSLSTTDLAKQFVKPGGDYYGSKQRFSSFPPPFCIPGNLVFGGQYFMDHYKVPKPAGPPEKKLNPVEVKRQVTVIIKVWDNACEDGDAISLKIDNQVLLNNYSIKKKAKQIEVTMVPGTYTMKLKAESSGTDCPPGRKKRSETLCSAAISFSGAVKNGSQSFELREGSVSTFSISMRP